MKKTLTTIATIAFLTTTVLATDLWLTWKSNPSSEMVTSYVIEQSKSPSTNFVPVVTVSGTTNVGVVKGLTAGSYKFRVVAKNSVGSAPPSSEVLFPTNAPSRVLELSITNSL